MEIIPVKQHINQDFHYSESVKTLRTNLMFSGVDIRSVAITSFHESEGKTTVSFHLAASLAESGKSVLLVDADLRRSQLAARLRCKGVQEGLSHFLSGMANADEVIQKTDLPGMYILFAGSKVPNAAELLGSKQFSRLMEELKKTFDYVIVDSAPLGLVIDCAVISSAVDGVMIAIDTTNNSAKLERKIVGQLNKVGAKILGVVLTKVDTSDKYGYYRKAYGYGEKN